MSLLATRHFQKFKPIPAGTISVCFNYLFFLIYFSNVTQPQQAYFLKRKVTETEP